MENRTLDGRKPFSTEASCAIPCSFTCTAHSVSVLSSLHWSQGISSAGKQHLVCTFTSHKQKHPRILVRGSSVHGTFIGFEARVAQRTGCHHRRSSFTVMSWLTFHGWLVACTKPEARLAQRAFSYVLYSDPQSRAHFRAKPGRLSRSPKTIHCTQAGRST